MDSLITHLREKLVEAASSAQDIAQAFERLHHHRTSLTDSNGILVRVSEAYCELLGYRPEELVGQHFAILVPKALRQEATELQADFIQKGAGHPSAYTIRTKDGTDIPIVLKAVIVTDEAGNRFKLAIVEPISSS
ncbi:MAG: PAS domain S-box protein [Bacteroidia bacterium]|nr:PAS domain S-box protein [Bacteroidia bacterium]